MENSNQQLEMHIRIKRAKTVLFLYVDPSETIRDVKNKIEALLGQPVAKQRLMKAEKVLEGEGSRLADLGIEYDDELLLVYKLEGAEGWEAPDAELLSNKTSALGKTA